MTCLPRTYMGHHYLSDLLAGALLGTLSVAVAPRMPLPAAAAADAWLRRLNARAPAALLLGFFVLGAECLHALESTRKVAAAAATSEATRAFVSDAQGAGEITAPAAVGGGGSGGDTDPALAPQEAGRRRLEAAN